MKHSRQRRIGLRKILNLFLIARPQPYYDVSYGRSSTPTPFCCVLKQNFQMTHENPSTWTGARENPFFLVARSHRYMFRMVPLVLSGSFTVSEENSKLRMSHEIV